MTDQALSTLPRRVKGPIAPPPALAGKLKVVADAVAGWPDVEATVHWRFDQSNRVDGVDFYVGSDELGHIHLDGSIHLAIPLWLGSELVAEGWGNRLSGRAVGRQRAYTGLVWTDPWRCSGVTTIGFGLRAISPEATAWTPCRPPIDVGRPSLSDCR